MDDFQNKAENDERVKHQGARNVSPSSSPIHGLSRGQVENDYWVQCEKPNCLKWRRMKAEEAAKLKSDTPWFCHLNPNASYDNCTQPQEDYSKFEAAAKKLKLRYVTSTLSVGSLVWAKLIGYVRWPAVVCPAPLDGRHVICDDAGHAHIYHVEFLGNKHSHSWVKQKEVEVYGKAPQELVKTGVTDSASFNAKPKIFKRGRKRKSLHYTSFNQSKYKLKDSYRGNTVIKAIEEADQMVNLSTTERLGLCQYVERPHGAKSTLGETHPDEKENHHRNKLELPLTSGKAKLDSSCKKGKHAADDKYKKKSASVISRPANPKLSTLKDSTSVNAKSIHPKIPPEGKQSPLQKIKNQPQKKSVNIISKKKSLEFCATKEEKFLNDLETFAENERQFEQELHNFHLRHQDVLPKSPCWKGVNVSYLQLYHAVKERGGFEKVTAERRWSEVCKDLLLVNDVGGTSSFAKKFYSRYLLPYELQQQRSSPMNSYQQAMSPQLSQQEVPESSNVVKAKSGIKDLKEQICDSKSAASDDLQDICTNLEETGNQITYWLLQDKIKKDSSRLGMSVQYYNNADDQFESPTRVSQLSFQAKEPEESAQIVPEIADMTSSSESTNQTTTGNDDTDDDDDSNTHAQVLHELQNLQQKLQHFETECDDMDSW